MQTSRHVCNICPLYFPVVSFVSLFPFRFINTHVVAHRLQTMLALCDSVSLVYMAPVPEVLDAHINASKTVLKQGEPLSLNCTAHGVELVFFSWEFPNKDVSGLKNKLLHLGFIQLHELSREIRQAKLSQDVLPHLIPENLLKENTFVLKI